MSLLVTGSIGIDTVTSPHGQADDVLGGSAIYFAFAASQYVPVRLVGVVGEDFPDAFRQTLASRDIDLAGLETRTGSKTFRWTGRYEGDMNEADTVDVKLNVLAEKAPTVPASFADSQTVFLANTHPTLQRELLDQLESPKLVVCDTMNLWIANERDSLIETLKRVNGVIINDAEARDLMGTTSIIEAGEKILALGPNFVMIKKGEHGTMLVTAEGPVPVPAFPTKLVRDPTGAGDSFAGGVMGFLSAKQDFGAASLRQALIRGTIAASFAIEDFSVERVRSLPKAELDARIDQLIGLLRYES